VASITRLLAALALLLTLGCSTAAAQIADATTPATVVRVVDGDTVHVQLADGTSETLRLIGIDTPEVVDPRKPVQCYGREASAHAHELLDGQAVTLELDPSQGERDKYGRLLAYVWLPDGRNFGETMLAEGYAYEYTYDEPYLYRDQFLAAQQSAMDAGLGLWAAEACVGWTDDVTATSEPAPAPPEGFRYDPAGRDRDCADFATHAEAQAFYEAAGGPERDPHRLDSDRNGLACETLP